MPRPKREFHNKDKKKKKRKFTKRWDSDTVPRVQIKAKRRLACTCIIDNPLRKLLLFFSKPPEQFSFFLFLLSVKSKKRKGSRSLSTNWPARSIFPVIRIKLNFCLLNSLPSTKCYPLRFFRLKDLPSSVKFPSFTDPTHCLDKNTPFHLVPFPMNKNPQETAHAEL